MSHIAIVGHPSSAHQAVLHLLIRNGVQEALPSRHQHMSVADIHAALYQSQGIPPLVHSAPDELLPQVLPEPAWRELMLDLLQTNQAHTSWVWGDPLGIHLLDHWFALSPQIRFVFVYAPPATAFLTDDATPNGHRADDVARQWLAFNATLLHMARRQPDRCHLVGVDTDGTCIGGGPSAASLLSLLDLPLLTNEPESSLVPKTRHMHAAARLIAAELAQRYPAMADLYRQLQAAAALPLPPSPTPPPEELHQLCRLLSHGAGIVQEETNALQEENQLMLWQLHVVQEELERYLLTHDGIEGGLARSAKPAGGRSAQTQSDHKDWGKAGRVLAHLKALRQARQLRTSELFDADWYLRQNADIAAVKAFARNPALHYLMHGANEGRAPSAQFSGEAYLQENPDVRRLGLNPLIHYICHGQAEGRSLGQ